MTTLLLAAGIQAQGWTPHRPHQSPPDRSHSQLAYDSVRDRVVMFGGWTGATPLGDTWEYDGTTWREIRTSLSPPPRHAHLLVFDPISARTLLFGGITTTSVNDTWSWDGTSWHLHSNLASSPSPRSVMGAAFFPPRGRIVTYGGQTGSFTFHADMWTWTGTAWEQEPAPPTSPGRRSQMGYAYDPLRQRLVLAGGHSYPPRAYHNDTWEYDGTTWTSVPATFPRTRSSFAMAFVPSTSRIVLFGGYTDPAALGDSWSYDGTAWSPLAVPAELVARESAFAVTDSARSRALLFGGFTRSQALSDTWTIGDAQAPTFVEHGNACGAVGSVPGLFVAVPPWQGEIFQVDLQVPNASALPLLALGSTANPPLDLSSFGAPACRLYFDVGAPHWLVPLTSQGGRAAGSISIPWGLAGSVFEVQGLMFDPAANALGLALTEGGTATVR